MESSKKAFKHFEILPFGDQALLINFQQKIDLEIHRQVMNLHKSIGMSVIEGITFTMPAYCSITIGYEPAKTTFQQIRAEIMKLKVSEVEVESSQKKLTVPVCYEEPYCLDLAEIMVRTGLTKEEIIKQHTGSIWHVFMLGFLPGFAYMGTLPEALHCPRKTTPRLRVPAGAVGIAGYQTGIYPCEAPGGWQIVGNTPIDLFDYNQSPPFLFKAGDGVRFEAISASQYQIIATTVRDRTFNWDSLHE